MPRKGTIALLVLLAGFTLTGVKTVRADDVMDSINQAIEAYRKGDYSGAAGNLDYAAQLMRQKRSERLLSFLPEPLPGWTGEEPKSQAVGQMMFGGMLSGERRYFKGANTITVTIVSDSPMLLQGAMVMLANPMFAGSEGGTLQRIKGQNAMVSYDSSSQSGSVKVIVANRVLVTIDGQGIAQKDLIDYASAINYQKLQSL